MISSSLIKYHSFTFWCPPLYVFAILNHDPGSLQIEAHENYQKRSWRNRATIISSNGKHTLSIPLERGKNNKMPIRSVRISNSGDWKTKHLRTLKTNYRSAPYFDHYFPKIKDLYAKEYTFLWDWNWEWMQFWIKTLDFSIKVDKTANFGGIKKSFHIMNSKNKPYIANNLNPEFWYPQVYEEKWGFIRSVSIIDALFCAGPETRSYLNSFFTPKFDSYLQHKRREL